MNPKYQIKSDIVRNSPAGGNLMALSAGTSAHAQVITGSFLWHG